MNAEEKKAHDASVRKFDKLLAELDAKRRILTALSESTIQGLTFKELEDASGIPSEIAYSIVQEYIADGVIDDRVPYTGTLKQKRHLHITGWGRALIAEVP